MKKRKRPILPPVTQAVGIMPPSTTLDALFNSFIVHETNLGVLDVSTIQAHTTRLVGTNGNSPVLNACRTAGIKNVGDLQQLSSFRKLNKQIERISATRAQANNLKSSWKKAIACNIELGNIVLPPGVVKGVRGQRNRPCSPAQLTDEQIDYIRKSRTGRTPFLASRNDLITELELLYGIRPGKEITMIDDANVHPLLGFMDILRDDGLMQRLYLRRDTCDRVIDYYNSRSKSRFVIKD